MVLFQIITDIVNWATALIHLYGPYSIFFAVILEEFLLPIPAPFVIMGGSFILVDPNLPLIDAVSRMFMLVVLPASIASTIGSFFGYGIGYYGGRAAINRFHKRLGFSWLDVRKIEKRLEKKKRFWTTIAMLRAVPFFPVTLISLTCGIMRMSKSRYAVSVFAGSLVRFSILAFIGWRLGSAYRPIADKLNILEWVVWVVVIMAVAYALYRYRHKYSHHYQRFLPVKARKN